MQGKDNIQPKQLAAKVSHLKTCINHLHDLTNLLMVKSPDHHGIQSIAEKAYLEAHQFDPRDIIMEEGARMEKDVCTEKDVYIETISYEGMRPLSDSASDLEIRLRDRSVVLTEILRSVLRKPRVLESYRTHYTQFISMITTLESLYNDLIPEDDDEPSHDAARSENMQLGVIDRESSPISPVTEGIVDTNISGLSPRVQQAWDQYEKGVEVLNKPNPTDDEVYDLLDRTFTAENARQENSSSIATLPERDTWKRSVRRARQVLGQQKNSPRDPHRTTRSGSIVRKTQI